MKAVEPIFVTELFAEIHVELISLLKNLAPEDWHLPTAAGNWKVFEIAAHLLDSDLRRLTFQRDQIPPIQPENPINEYRDLVDFLNKLNADWIKTAQRISPKILVQFLEITGPQVADLFRSLNPFATGFYSVAWAGESTSPNWFDIAREYTEKWHHQQQIRESVKAAPLTGRKWLYPVLDTFMRGLPHTFRFVKAAPETGIVISISGEAGGNWTMIRKADKWDLFFGSSSDYACRIHLEQDTAWKLLTKGLSSEKARELIIIEGEKIFGEPIFGMLSIMG